VTVFKSFFSLSLAVFFAALAPLKSVPAKPIVSARQAIMYDMKADMILFEDHGYEAMVPSSLTKSMLVYLVFQALKEGRLQPKTCFRVSDRARNMKGSRMFLEKGSEVSVDLLLRGVIVHSGNDAALTLAEGLYGSEAKAVTAMNKLAKKWGFQKSHFFNVTGWPQEGHVSSAYDMLVLGKRTIQDFPLLYKRYYGQAVFTYNNIQQYNRNPLVHQEQGDGLKTGNTTLGGFGLLGSAERHGRRLIFVINGCASEAERAKSAFSLLSWGFRLQPYSLFSKDVKIGSVSVVGGVRDQIGVMSLKDVVIACLPQGRKQVKVSFKSLNVKAPIEKGQKVGVLEISIPGLGVVERALVANEGMDKPSLWGRTIRDIWLFLESLFLGTKE